MINGRRLPMIHDINLGVRYMYNGMPAYGDVKGVIYARESEVKHAIFLELAPRRIVVRSPTAPTVLEPTGDTVFVELFAALTHIVKFAPTRPLGHYLCLKIWATRPGWEIK
jgi:hypothetical protein